MVRFTSFTIHAFGGTLCYDKPLLGFWEGIEYEQIYVYLKDGTVVESKILLSEIEGEFLHQRKNGDFGKYAGWPAVFQSASEDVPDVPQIQRYPHAE